MRNKQIELHCQKSLKHLQNELHCRIKRNKFTDQFTLPKEKPNTFTHQITLPKEKPSTFTQQITMPKQG